MKLTTINHGTATIKKSQQQKDGNNLCFWQKVHFCVHVYTAPLTGKLSTPDPGQIRCKMQVDKQTTNCYQSSDSAARVSKRKTSDRCTRLVSWIPHYLCKHSVIRILMNVRPQWSWSSVRLDDQWAKVFDTPLYIPACKRWICTVDRS